MGGLSLKEFKQCLGSYFEDRIAQLVSEYEKSIHEHNQGDGGELSLNEDDESWIEATSGVDNSQLEFGENEDEAQETDESQLEFENEDEAPEFEEKEEETVETDETQLKFDENEAMETAVIPDADASQLRFCFDEAIRIAVDEYMVDHDSIGLASFGLLISWSMHYVEFMKFEVRKEGGDECPICMSEMELVRVAPCGHSFHGWCLMKWLVTSDVGSKPRSCPICRSKLSRHAGVLLPKVGN